MKMNDFTLLSKDEILGENHLDIVDVAGVRSKLTDYAVFLGAYPTQTDYGNYWTKTTDRDTVFAFMVDYEERVKMLSKYRRINSARVVYNVPKNIEEPIIYKASLTLYFFLSKNIIGNINTNTFNASTL